MGRKHNENGKEQCSNNPGKLDEKGGHFNTMDVEFNKYSFPLVFNNKAHLEVVYIFHTS